MDTQTVLDARILNLIATVIGREGPCQAAPGHPPAETVRVLDNKRLVLCDGRLGFIVHALLQTA